jgi:ABC-type glycerol-3-phosphate transport system substrate-binding protein
MSKFQIILTGIFVAFIVIGVTVFATYKSKDEKNALPPITIWGTFPEAVFSQFVSKVNSVSVEPVQINYFEIPESNFDKSFIEALARGEGPDAILIPQTLLYKHEDKVIPIPFDILTERDFRNTFIELGELYVKPQVGTLALPFVVDPLVMYWNRDTFTNAGIASFPRHWDEFGGVGAKITQKDVNSNVRRSTIAMGEFSNVNHAKEILGALFLQSGNPVTVRNSDGGVSSAIGSGVYDGLGSSLPALQFFTKFSDPRNPEYSWNRSLPNSKNAFLAQNLATYIGYASELFDLRQKNPNLDFDVSLLPQAPGGANRVTYGKMYGFSIVKSTKDTSSTFEVLKLLLTPASLNELVSLVYLPPVRRDMIASGSTDPYLSIFYDSALISKGWLDSSVGESERIFREIVEDVTSGRKRAEDALDDGNDLYDLSLQNI